MPAHLRKFLLGFALTLIAVVGCTVYAMNKANAPRPVYIVGAWSAQVGPDINYFLEIQYDDLDSHRSEQMQVDQHTYMVYGHRAEACRMGDRIVECP